jgi:hypothetical protein
VDMFVLDVGVCALLELKCAKSIEAWVSMDYAKVCVTCFAYTRPSCGKVLAVLHCLWLLSL